VRLNVRRWGIFNLVGFGGFVLQIGTVAVLTRVFGCPSIVSTAIGLEVAALHNFVGHSRWTWNERSPVDTAGSWTVRFVRYQVAKTVSLAASLSITTLLVYFAHLPVELASAMAVVICALPNYFVAEHLVFTR
jgi:putative flippase GtrA